MSNSPGTGLLTYSDLIKAVEDWLSRSDLTDRIPDFIRLTEVELQRDLNMREHEKALETAFVAGQDHIQLPGDHLWTRQVRINTDPIRMMTIVGLDKFNDVRQNRNGLSHPIAACQVGDRLMLAPAPAAADPITLFYMAEIQPLSDDNQQNQITRIAPDALLYGALTHSAPYIGDDPRIQIWSSYYEKAKESFKRMEWRSRTGGGPLHIRPDTQPDDRHNIGGD